MTDYYEQKYNDSYKQVLKSIECDSTNVSAFLLLSDLCLELKKPDQRIWSLEKVTLLAGIEHSVAYKYLGKDYFNIGYYALAKEKFEKYLGVKRQNDSTEILNWINRCEQCSIMILDAKNIDIEHLNSTINTFANEYWPAISIDDSTLYFTRLIKDEAGALYERIFYSATNEKGWEEAQELVLSGEGLSNEGTMCFSANGELLFFTACERSDGYGSCDLYYSRKIDDLWVKPVNAGSRINTINWEAQPSVSADGKDLYFASSRKDGLGKKDIWKSKISDGVDGELIFSSPENLGPLINTSENDYSPFIHSDNQTLYFASTGRITLGGADLFYSRRIDSGWLEAKSLGYPINSRFEDDGLVVSSTAQVAVFSSNRDSSVNQSKDLYQFKMPDEFAPSIMGYIKGFVFDDDSKEKINAIIEFVELTTGKTQRIKSSIKEGYTLLINTNSSYALTINEENYLLFSEYVNLKAPNSFNESNVFDVYLSPIKAELKVVLNNIFFDFDSFNLKTESTVELVQLINFLKSNPKIKIEISGHTDNKGVESYNQKLSERRAKAIVDFLVTQIAPERISFKGYGSSQPIDSNDTELGRLKNRRSEFKILSY